ncbi:MAG: FG-GAP repeat protein [Ignavibacteria bacterium]|nr:FG-GAP repeat protein [Ignavibacteria bacterium]
MNNIADVTMTGETTNNDFGTYVSSAGDLNGDGYSDVIVGAPDTHQIPEDTVYFLRRRFDE